MPVKITVNFTDEALKRVDVKGRYKIEFPQIVNGKMQFGANEVHTQRFICQAPYMRKDGTIDVCNNPMKTVIGMGTGDQAEIIECGKCRSQYIMRTIYNKVGNVKYSTSVWDIGRKVAKEGRLWTDREDYTSYVKFAQKK